MASFAAASARVASVTGTRRARRAKWTEDHAAGPVEFALAWETEAFDRAFRLVHDQYVLRDYMAPDPAGRRINLRHALPSTRVFVGRRRSDVVGTVTLFQDSALGLPMDDVYKAELDVLRAGGRRLAEVSHLATSPENRMAGIAVVMRLFRIMLLYAADFAELDDLCLVVKTGHEEFYTKFFDCRVIGGVKPYGAVNGVSAVPMVLDMHWVRHVMAETRAGRSREHEVRSFLYDPDVLDGLAVDLRRDGPRSGLTSRQFAHLFEGSATLENARSEERRFVESIHRDLTSPAAVPAAAKAA
jgi:N-acyl amino acid synthase FeeM